MGAAITPTLISCPSPNFGPRRLVARPDLVVLHYTAMLTAQSALDRLCDPAAEVSCHYLISEKGQCYQLVNEPMRAWHAGAGQWGDVTDVNSRSIGIELANTGAHPFPEPQMNSLELLLSGIMKRWVISPERVIGHSDMAPTRKFDPGARFDWQRLALMGLGIWPTAGAVDSDFETAALAFGYPPDIDPDKLLAAFRLRFRPHATGPIDDTDRAMICDLARRFPVDRSPLSA